MTRARVLSIETTGISLDSAAGKLEDELNDFIEKNVHSLKHISIVPATQTYETGYDEGRTYYDTERGYMAIIIYEE